MHHLTTAEVDVQVVTNEYQYKIFAHMTLRLLVDNVDQAKSEFPAKGKVQYRAPIPSHFPPLTEILPYTVHFLSLLFPRIYVFKEIALFSQW